MSIVNTVKLVLEDSQLTSGLNKLSGKVDGLNSKFAGLKNALSGLALGSLIQQTLNFADSIQDLSDATGIATANILGFQTAVQQSGGNAEAAGNAILKLVGNIEGAASGSAELQSSFAKVGVSLEDLRTLSEQDILKKTIDGLGRIGSVSEQVALKQQLLGKEMRSVAVESLAANYANATRESQKYADSIKAAAETQARLEGALNQLRLTLLQILDPITKFIAGLDVKAINTLVDGLVKAGTILLVFKGYSLAAAAALGVLTAAAGGAAGSLVAMAATIISRFTLIGKVIAGLGLVATGVKAFFPDLFASISDGADAAIQKLKGFAGIKSPQFLDAKEIERENYLLDQRSKSLQQNTENNRGVTDSNQKLFDSLQKIVSAFQIGNGEYNKRFDLETKLIGASEAAKMAATERFNVESKYLAELGKLTEQYAEKQEQANAGDPKAAESLPKIRDAIVGLTDAYKVQIAEVDKLTAARVKSVQAEQLAIFATKSMAEAQSQANDFANQAANLFLPLQAKGYAELEQAAYRAAKAQIAAEESRRGVSLDPSEATRYYEAARQGIEEVKKSQEALNDATSRYNLLQFQRKAEIDINKQVRDIQHEMATSTMTSIQKKYEDITYAAKENARAAIEAEEARRGAPLNQSEVEAYYQAATVGAEKLRRATELSYSKSREFTTGWKKALNDYADEAGNAAKRAENIFKKATGGMEDALVKFAKTGKFEWKGFVAMMLEELLRAQIQQIFAQLLGGMQDSMGGMSSMFGGGGGGQQQQDSGGGIFDAIGSIFGMGGGGAPGSSANNPMYVISVGGGMGGIGGDPLGDFINQLPGMQEDTGGGGIFDSIGSIFGGIGDSISGAFGGITDAIGGIFGGGGGGGGGQESGGGFFDSIASGIGDFFGGWFANGGTLGAGKFGIAGEAGPELISGPATVTPMGGGSNVTFNINAVDAQSFKAMIAADPAFLYGVAMQGAKGIPMRG